MSFEDLLSTCVLFIDVVVLEIATPTSSVLPPTGRLWVVLYRVTGLDISGGTAILKRKRQ